MPRNGAGVYSLPAGNPVSPNTLIEAAWANSTLNDVAAEITNSLARSGVGGMTGPLRLPDGIVTAPAVAFNLETATGLYRVGTGRLGLATLGVQRFAISGADATFSVPVIANSDLTVGGNVTVSGTISGTFSGNGSGLTSLNASNISSGTLADARLSSNVALRNAANTFTADQTIAGSSGIALTVNGVATQYAARFNGGTIASGDLAGIDVVGSTPNFVVSVFRNANASGSTSLEVIQGGGAARAFVAAFSGHAAFGSNVSAPVYLYSANAVRIIISENGNVTINAPVSGSHTINGNVSFGGTVSGNGSGLTSLNASNISSGTLADARLSGNVALRNAWNTFTGEIVIDAGSNSGITVRASETAQVRLECTGATTNNKNWIVYADTISLRFTTYPDSYSGGATAMAIGRSGATPGPVYTYSSLFVGQLQSSTGYMGIQTGGGSASGYAAFYSPSGTRVGYIGFATTFGTGDNGTIPYVAGAHSFTGRANTVPVSVSFSATPTFNSAQSNTIYFGTMTGNVTSMTISNPVDGAQLQIRFVQDATGGRTVTLPSNVQVSGSLNTSANAATWLVLTYVSSASRWEGTWTRVS